MAVSSVGVTTGTDKYLHTNSRSISSQTREDQYILPGEAAYPTFAAIASNISLATSASHLLFIQADGTLYSRLKRVVITPTNDIPAAASVAQIQIVRTSTAGSGGSSVTCQPFDTADSYSGTAQTLPSSKGTEGVVLWECWLPLPAALGDSLAVRSWEPPQGGKPIVFGTGTGAGICFKVVTGIASATVTIVAEFTTTTYL